MLLLAQHVLEKSFLSRIDFLNDTFCAPLLLLTLAPKHQADPSSTATNARYVPVTRTMGAASSIWPPLLFPATSAKPSTARRNVPRCNAASPTSVATPATAAVTTRPARRASILIAMRTATGEFGVGLILAVQHWFLSLAHALHVNVTINSLNPSLPLNKNSTCNSITWNDQDCGECIIDEAGNPSFDCSSVGGPDGTTIGEDITMPDEGGAEPTDPPVDGGDGVIDPPQNGGEGGDGSDDTTSAAGNDTKRAVSLSLLVGIAGVIAALA